MAARPELDRSITHQPISTIQCTAHCLTTRAFAELYIWPIQTACVPLSPALYQTGYRDMSFQLEPLPIVRIVMAQSI